MQGGIATEQDAASMRAMMPDPGMEIAPITDADRQQYGLDPALTGVLVTRVKPDSEASYLGVTPGDVITAVDRTPIATPDDVHKALKSAHDRDRPYVAVLFQTKTGAHWGSISISSRKH
jgi:S1-C subfamily serine protease